MALLCSCAVRMYSVRINVNLQDDGLPVTWDTCMGHLRALHDESSIVLAKP